MSYLEDDASFLQAASCGDLNDHDLKHYLASRQPFELDWEAFKLAAQNGHHNLVMRFLEFYKGRLRFARDMLVDKVSPLHLATREGHLEVVQAIVDSLRWCDWLSEEKNWGPHQQWWDGIIGLAVLNNHPQIVQHLVRNPLFKAADPNAASRRLLLPLAAHKGHSDTLKVLIDECRDEQVLRHKDDGLTLLHLAAQSGCATQEVLQLLLHCGILDVNVRSAPDRFTPLHMAANSGQVDVVRTLLRSLEPDFPEAWKVDPMARDCMGRTPLHYAAREGHFEVVRLFLEREPQPNAVDHTDLDGLTPLHMAARGGHVQVIEILLQSQHGLNIMGACMHSVQLRSLFNISFGSRRFFGRPQSAICFPRPKLIDSLFWRTGGFTALHFAARYGHHEAVKILLKVRAKIINHDVKNSAKFRSYELAVTQNQENMFQEIYLQLEKAGDGADVSKLIMQIGCMNSRSLTIAMKEVSEEMQAMKMLQYPWEGPLPITILSQSKADLLTSEEVRAIECIMDEEWEKHCNKHDREVTSSLKGLYSKGGEEWAMQSNGRQLVLHWAACRGDISWVKRLLAHETIDINEKDDEGRTALDIALGHGNVETATELLLHPNMKLNDLTLDKNMSNFIISTGDSWAFQEDCEDFSERVRERMQYIWKNLLLALLVHPNVCENVAMLKPLLVFARKYELTEVVRVIFDRTELKRSILEDRKMYLDSANAILVGAALIAAVAYQGWLQPPLGYTFEYEDAAYADLEEHEAVRYFWWFNSFAFFFSMASLITGAVGAMPVMEQMDVLNSVEKAKRAVAVASIFLGMAVMCVAVAFSVAGFGVVPPLPHTLQIMRVSVSCGATLCSISLIGFLRRLRILFSESFPFLLLPFQAIEKPLLKQFIQTIVRILYHVRNGTEAVKGFIPYCRAYCTIIVGHLLFLIICALRDLGLSFDFLRRSLIWFHDSAYRIYNTL